MVLVGFGVIVDDKFIIIWIGLFFFFKDLIRFGEGLCFYFGRFRKV